MERYKHEGALRKSGVGNIKVGLVKYVVTIQQQVEVEGAGSVGNRCRSIAPEVALDAEKSRQQRGGRQVSFESNHSIQEAGLILKSHRGGRIQRGAAQDLADGGEAIGRRGQRDLRRTGRAGHVGSHPDVADLHEFRVARREAAQS
jgi:hypothetical protein